MSDQLYRMLPDRIIAQIMRINQILRLAEQSATGR